jgi:CRP/FNR family transcriptional regulator, cyclic AMP receptor protein
VSVASFVAAQRADHGAFCGNCPDVAGLTEVALFERASVVSWPARPSGSTGGDAATWRRCIPRRRASPDADRGTMDRHVWIDERLAEVPLFEGLSKQQLRRISSLMTRIDRPGGQVLTREGEQGSEFFIVLEGEVEVRRGDRVIATRRPGDYVGEIALLDKRPRTASVVATTPVSVEVLSRREFVSLLAEAPELSEQIMATMARRLAELEIETTS